METTTETNQNNRELTTTEIQIAIAQIKDRLIRIAKAQNEMGQRCEDVSEDDYETERAQISAELRKKYDIPDGVYLFREHDDEPLLPGAFVKACESHIGAFVRGALTEDGMTDLLWFFEETAECDYGWVLVEQPLGYYDSADDLEMPCMKDTQAEIRSIGMRSARKNKRLDRSSHIKAAIRD